MCVFVYYVYTIFLKGNFTEMGKLKLYLPALEKVVSSLTTQGSMLDLHMAYSIANILSQVASEYLRYVLQTLKIFGRVQPMRRTHIKELTQEECAEIF